MKAHTPDNTEEKKTARPRQLVGVVVASKMQDTVTVRVERFVKHPKYHKFYARSKTYHAHDPGNTTEVGERVTIKECRPISKTKRFTIVKP